MSRRVYKKGILYDLRKYAPRCFICHLPITPDPGQEETVRIVAMDRSFHVNCYKCEVRTENENGGLFWT